MIFLVSDIHGHIRLEFLKQKIQKMEKSRKLTKHDYLLICGDAGIVWDSKENQQVVDFYNSQEFTTLFVDGNHENFDLLENFPVEEWNGGKIHRISKKIIHLMRGEIFNIQGKSLFVFGGGFSAKRLTNSSPIFIWERELPDQLEIENGIRKLEEHNFTCDYIITHSIFKNFAQTHNFNWYKEEQLLSDFLQIVSRKCTFKGWYFGHYHKDVDFGKYHCIYERMEVLQ